MRTVFVNPSASMMGNPRKRRKRRKSKPAAKSAPKRRRRRHTAVLSSSGPVVVKRVNAGITPFVSNPLVRSRRRSRRRNPLATALQPRNFVKKAVTYGGGSLVGAGANILVLRNIQNDWMRNGARVATAVLGAAFMPNDFGAAMAGATLYPLWAELALKFNLVQAPKATASEIDLNEISVDLESALGDDGEELFEW